MDASSSHTKTPDQNQSLLEGLFQLALNGDAGSEDFAAIEQEVHARLLDTYKPAG